MTARYIGLREPGDNPWSRRNEPKRTITDDELTAFHESGHALGHVIAQGKIPVEMWINERGGGGCLGMHPDKGSTWEPNRDGGKSVMAAVTNGLKPSVSARKTFKPSLVTLVCAEIAQRKRACGDRSEDYIRHVCGDDRDKLCSVLRSITANQAEFNRMLHEITTEARRIVDTHWNVIEELARDLLEFRRLDERAIKAIVGDLIPDKDEESRRRPASRNVDDDVLHHRMVDGESGVRLKSGEVITTRSANCPAGFRPAASRNGFLVFVPK